MDTAWFLFKKIIVFVIGLVLLYGISSLFGDVNLFMLFLISTLFYSHQRTDERIKSIKSDYDRQLLHLSENLQKAKDTLDRLQNK